LETGRNKRKGGALENSRKKSIHLRKSESGAHILQRKKGSDQGQEGGKIRVIQFGKSYQSQKQGPVRRYQKVRDTLRSQKEDKEGDKKQEG